MAPEKPTRQVSAPKTPESKEVKDPLIEEIEGATGAKRTKNAVEIYTSGPEAFTAIEKAIDGAKSSIRINLFAWLDDATGMRIVEKIIAAKNKNKDLDVLIRVDRLGCFFHGCEEKLKDTSTRLQLIAFNATPKFMKAAAKKDVPETRAREMLKILIAMMDDHTVIFGKEEEAGLLEELFSSVVTNELLFSLNEPLRKLSEQKNIKLIIEDNKGAEVDHSKVFVFDDAVAFSGGMNIGNPYSGGIKDGKWNGDTANTKYWRDQLLKMEGPVSDICLEHSYKPEEMPRGKTPSPEIPTGDSVIVLRNRPGRTDGKKPEELAKMKQITHTVNKLIDSATSEILIEHAYIMHDETVTKLVDAAQKRGVKVKVLRGLKEEDSLERVNERFFKKLESCKKIEIYRNDERILHSKILCIDGKYTLVGSACLNKLSLEHHEEISFLLVRGTAQETFRAYVMKHIEDVKAKAAKTKTKR